MFNLFKHRARPAAPAQSDERLFIVPVPSLVAILLALEKKGSPLTKSEVLEATDNAPSIAMTARALAAVAEEPEYDDNDPESARKEWQAIRPSLHEVTAGP